MLSFLITTTNNASTHHITLRLRLPTPEFKQLGFIQIELEVESPWKRKKAKQDGGFVKSKG